MSASISLTGNVGTDIEVHGGGAHEWTYANFRMASTDRLLRNGTWQDGTTLWLSVLCKNRQLAENVKASIAKGDAVVVTGRLTMSTFTRDDQQVERFVLEATSVGHDLCRGTSTFRRRERQVAEPNHDEHGDDEAQEFEASPAPEPQEALSALASSAA